MLDAEKPSRAIIRRFLTDSAFVDSDDLCLCPESADLSWVDDNHLPSMMQKHLLSVRLSGTHVCTARLVEYSVEKMPMAIHACCARMSDE